MSFKQRLVAACQTAVIWTVQAIVVLVLLGGAAYGVIGDYLATRVKAQQGAVAFDYINKVLAEQQKAQAQPGVATPAPTK